MHDAEVENSRLLGHLLRAAFPQVEATVQFGWKRPTKQLLFPPGNLTRKKKDCSGRQMPHPPNDTFY